MLDWNSLIDDRTKVSDLLVVPNVEVSKHNSLKENRFIVNIPQYHRISNLNTLERIVLAVICLFTFKQILYISENFLLHTNDLEKHS